MAAPTLTQAIPVAKSVNQHLLNSTVDEFRKLQPSASGRPYDKIVIGAATLQSSGTPRILLLKRAAHEPYFPNVFELPSGKVDLDDPTLKHALVREVYEETGLYVTEILAELKPMIYTTEKTIVDDTARETLVSKSAIQLNYVVSVSDGEVKLSADEHSESCWAGEQELGKLDITEAMSSVIQEAFEWAASRRAGLASA
jgi:8-oxo-dGTP pyrophosphatase MutT (NUDIX family)